MINHTKQGLNQFCDIVKGGTGRSYSLPGIAVGDKILRVSRHRFTGTTGTGFIGSSAYLTIAQWSVSAANTIYKKGLPASFPLMHLFVNWVDVDGHLNT